MKQRSFLTAGLILLTLLGGCSSVDRIQPNIASVPESSEVKLGFSAWPGWFPWQVAQDKKIFEARKVNVKTKWFDNYNDSIAALETDKIDANSQTLGDTISSIAKGNDLVVVLTNDNSTGNDVIVIDEKIKSIKDLKGKRVAAEEGTVDHFLLVQALKRAGMSIKDIKFMSMETSKAADAFVNGQVEAAAIFAPFTTKALKRPGSRELFSSKDFPGLISDHLVFKRKFVNQYPEKVQSIVDSWFDTIKYINNSANIKESNIIMAKRAGVNMAEYNDYVDGTKIFTIEENVEAFKPGNDSTYLSKTAAETSKFLFENGLTKTKVDTSRIFDDRFVRNNATQMTK
ncbi:ABC transporter substrate-binding protein [Chamaesiphon sp.]|uniref:ABC transporter substrate-binding protein n=1 Tax=Chamaesiphon sp. TaxID=2814140 RepID=UPI0035939E93